MPVSLNLDPYTKNGGNKVKVVYGDCEMDISIPPDLAIRLQDCLAEIHTQLKLKSSYLCLAIQNQVERNINWNR